MTDSLYIHVKDWDEHQPRSDRPNLPWLRLHTKLLGNDAWLDLSCADTKLLVTIWMLSQRYGNGRVKADQAWLMAQSNVPHGPRSRNLERLVQAGFLTLSTTKAEPSGGLEEKGSKEPFKKRARERRPAEAAPPRSDNGNQPHLDEDDEPLSREEQIKRREEAQARLASLPTVKEL